jgi:hypothetical protein
VRVSRRHLQSVSISRVICCQSPETRAFGGTTRDLRSGQYPDLFGTLFITTALRAGVCVALCMKELGTHYTHSVHWSLPSCKYTALAVVHQTGRKTSQIPIFCTSHRGSPVSGIVHKSSWTFELLQSQQSLHLFSCVRQPSADRHRLHIVSSFVLDEPAYIQPHWMCCASMHCRLHRLVLF